MRLLIRYGKAVPAPKKPDDRQFKVGPVLRGPAPSNGGWLLGGAPRIHGELLKLGIDIGESSVTKGRETA